MKEHRTLIERWQDWRAIRRFNKRGALYGKHFNSWHARIGRRLSTYRSRFRVWWPLVWKRDYQKIESQYRTAQHDLESTRLALDEVGKAVDVWIPKFSQLYLMNRKQWHTLSVTVEIDERMLYGLAEMRGRHEALNQFMQRLAHLLVNKIDEVPPDWEREWQDQWRPAPGMMKHDVYFEPCANPSDPLVPKRRPS